MRIVESQMKQQRLDGLADGIFAIVMTLLAWEFKIPAITDPLDAISLWIAVSKLYPVLISFILSFALLFTYWRAHHYIISVYSKTLTVKLASLNALFFALITLVPFSARLLGEYANNITAISVYGLNVILIGLSLYWMRKHIEKNPTIDTIAITKADRRSGYIRILFPVYSAIFAIVASFWNTDVSKVLFAFAIIFNLLPASTNIIHYWLDKFFDDDEDLLASNHNTGEAIIDMDD